MTSQDNEAKLQQSAIPRFTHNEILKTFAISQLNVIKNYYITIQFSTDNR